MLFMQGNMLTGMAEVEAPNEAKCKSLLLAMAAQPAIRKANPLVKCMSKESAQYRAIQAAVNGTPEIES